MCMQIIFWILVIFANAISTITTLGLGTTLLSLTGSFYPYDILIARTAFIHLIHDIWRTIFLRTKINWPLIYRFTVPTLLGAVIGSLFVTHYQYILRIILALMLITLSLVQLLGVTFEIADRILTRHLSLSGFISGFLAGVTGLSGLSRGQILLAMDLTQASFLSTMIITSLLTSIGRTFTYLSMGISISNDMVLFAGMTILTSCVGVWIGNTIQKYLNTQIFEKIVLTAIVILGCIMIVTTIFGGLK